MNAERMPPQYEVGARCTECMCPLSRYNPYVVCGPCRMKLANMLADDDESEYSWEKFERRPAVRRGPLLDTTLL